MLGNSSEITLYKIHMFKAVPRRIHIHQERYHRGIKPIAVGMITLCSLNLQWRSPANAQVIPDSTLSTTVTTTDALNFIVDGGNRAGANLFHSFDQFSIPTNGSVQFNNAIAIDTIIGRITGAEPSAIDGLIQAKGTAHLFLLNPNGFLFGPNARLDIGGSFLATTADSLLFDNAINFSATQPQNLLSITAPVGLQMGTNPGAIQVLGPGHQLSQPNNFTNTTNLATEALGLEVFTTQTLALIGGTLTLDGGVLTAPGGHIELAGLEQGRVALDPGHDIWTFEYNRPILVPITLRNDALVDVSSAPSGSISLQGSVLTFKTGATLLSQNFGPVPAETITVNASESLFIQGVDSNNFRSSIRSEVLGNGAGSAVIVQTPLLHIRNGGEIRTSTFGTGASGNIRIHAEEAAQVIGISPLDSGFNLDISAIAATAVSGAGNSGDIDIRTRNLQIKDGAVITTATFFGEGNGGAITIQADSIRLGGRALQFAGSGISSATLTEGNAGDIKIQTQELIILGGNVVDSSTVGSGNAGDLNIVATDRIVVRYDETALDDNQARTSAINSGVFIPDLPTSQIFGITTVPTGNAGNLRIDTSSLHITNGGFVSITAQNEGNAGRLEIEANTITLTNQGTIAATTTSGSGGNVTLNTNVLRLNNGLINASSLTSGTGGNITIRASERVEVVGLGSEALRTDAVIPAFTGTFTPDNITQGISAFALEKGQAGQIQIHTDRLWMREGAVITSSAFKNSMGEDINVRAADIELVGSVLTTSTFGSGRAGNITVNTENMLLRGGSQFLSATFGAGRAGDLTVEASRQMVLDGRSFSDGFFASGLSAGVQNGGIGDGGDMTVTTPLLVIQNGAEISASAVANPFLGFPSSGRSRNRLSVDTHDTRASRDETAAETGAQAGNIDLQVGTLILNNGQITAISAEGKGGDIILNLDNGLILAENSAISTQAGNESSSGGDGGNMVMRSPFIAAVGNSDIVADARDGNGGTIQITTQGLFNIEVREALTPNNDITSSSQSGVSGNIRITTLDIDPSKDAIVLPTTVTDPTQQIATACSTTDDSRFVIIGQGGLPTVPNGESDRPWPHILPDFGLIPDTISPTTALPSSSIAPSASIASNASIASTPAVVPPPSPLHEATTMLIAPNGEIQLTAAMILPRPTAPHTCMPHPYPSLSFPLSLSP